MKKIIFLILCIIFIMTSIFAIETPQNIELIKGKNNLTTKESFKPIYVKDFIKQYPEIEVISYNQDQKTIGFVNLFEGIGINFIIEPSKNYEIITKSNITISLVK